MSKKDNDKKKQKAVMEIWISSLKDGILYCNIESYKILNQWS